MYDRSVWSGSPQLSSVFFPVFIQVTHFRNIINSFSYGLSARHQIDYRSSRKGRCRGGKKVIHFPLPLFTPSRGSEEASGGVNWSSRYWHESNEGTLRKAGVNCVHKPAPTYNSALLHCTPQINTHPFFVEQTKLEKSCSRPGILEISHENRRWPRRALNSTNMTFRFLVRAHSCPVIRLSWCLSCFFYCQTATVTFMCASIWGRSLVTCFTRFDGNKLFQHRTQASDNFLSETDALTWYCLKKKSLINQSINF